MLPATSDGAGALVRRLSFAPLFFVVVANMVGTGIFTTSGFMMADLGRPWLLLAAWAVGGLLALTGALCFAELGARLPAAGGDYVFLRAAYGDRMGFVSGWVSLLVGFSAPIAAAAITFGHHVASVFFPDGAAARLAPPALALTAVLGLSLVHAGGPATGMRIQGALTAAKIVFVIGFCALGALFGHGSATHFSLLHAAAPGGSAAFAQALVLVTFAYTGWNAAAYLGGEARRPERDVPLAILSGTLFVMAVYLALNLVFIYALPPAQMAGVADVGHRAAEALFGARIGNAFALAIALLLLSTIGAMVLTGPRVYFAMAQDGMFFRALATVDPRTQVPRRALWLQAAISIAMVATSTFEALLSYVGVVLSITGSLTVLGLVRIRRRAARAAARDPAAPVYQSYKTWLYPLPPLLFVLINLWIVVWSVHRNPVIALAAGGTLAIGYGLAVVFDRRRHRREHC